ncbi:MAG: DUF6364 family protein [Candidatus Poribacteria bacterium]
MSKTKLTLYVDEDALNFAHKLAHMTGQPISKMVGEYLWQKQKASKVFEIDDKILQWVGTLNTSKDYKDLRAGMIGDQWEKYENLD